MEARIQGLRGALASLPTPVAGACGPTEVLKFLDAVAIFLAREIDYLRAAGGEQYVMATPKSRL